MPGHRVIAEVVLLAEDAGGLRTPVQEGNRSIIVAIDEEGDHRVQLGTVFERVEGSGEPGSTFRAELLFWHDVAAIHATPGTAFTLWYGRDVGCGRVVEVLPTW